MPKAVFVHLECAYCHAKLQVPANVPEVDPRTAPWVQVVFQDEAEVFCSPNHAAQWLKNKSAIIVPETNSILTAHDHGNG